MKRSKFLKILGLAFVAPKVVAGDVDEINTKGQIPIWTNNGGSVPSSNFTYSASDLVMRDLGKEVSKQIDKDMFRGLAK
jgi:hypothetical protein